MPNLLQKQEKIPKMLVKLSKRKGTKFRGIIKNPHMIFHSTTPTPGIRRSRVSAKSTINATQAARSSTENRIPVAIRALWPNYGSISDDL